MPADSTPLIQEAQNSAKGSFNLFTGNALSLIILAVGSILVSRMLGPDNYGLLSIALTVPLTLVGLTDLGINSAMIRYSAKMLKDGETERLAAILKTGLMFSATLGLAISVACYVLSDVLAMALYRPEIGYVIRLVSLLVVFETVFRLFSSIFIGLNKTKSTALIMNIQAVSKAILAPVLVVFGFSLMGASIGYVASYVTATVVGCIFVIKYYKALGGNSGNISLGDLKMMMKYGFPLYGSAVLLLFQAQYQTIVLAFFASNAEIGNFNIAITLSAMMNVLIYPLIATFPTFSRLKTDGSEVKQVFKKSAKYTALLVVPAVVLIALLSKDIVYTIYGSTYTSAGFYLQLYILSFLSVGLGSIALTYLLKGIGETRLFFKWTLMSFLIFLPFAPIATAFWGIPGLIAAYLFSNIMSLSYSYLNAAKKKYVSLDVRGSVGIYFAACMAAIPIIVISFFLQMQGLQGLLVNSVIFLIAYLTLLPLTKAIKHSDVDNFKLMFKNIKFAWPIIKVMLAFESKLLSFMPQA
ncbi:MAG: flippase [Candidatus Bathyarchaeota archaeon]|nr:flippase [Candidatus Bathyarchaeota archaeon]